MLTNMGLMVTEQVRWYVKEASCSEDRSQSILAASSLLNQGRAVAVVMDVAVFFVLLPPPPPQLMHRFSCFCTEGKPATVARRLRSC